MDRKTIEGKRDLARSMVRLCERRTAEAEKNEDADNLCLYGAALILWKNRETQLNAALQMKDKGLDPLWGKDKTKH